jgi:hypothetical protein
MRLLIHIARQRSIASETFFSPFLGRRGVRMSTGSEGPYPAIPTHKDVDIVGSAKNDVHQLNQNHEGEPWWQPTAE